MVGDNVRNVRSGLEHGLGLKRSGPYPVSAFMVVHVAELLSHMPTWKLTNWLRTREVKDMPPGDGGGRKEGDVQGRATGGQLVRWFLIGKALAVWRGSHRNQGVHLPSAEAYGCAAFRMSALVGGGHSSDRQVLVAPRDLGNGGGQSQLCRGLRMSRMAGRARGRYFDTALAALNEKSEQQVQNLKEFFDACDVDAEV